MARSNMFANIENQFENSSNEKITNIAMQGFVDVIEFLNDKIDNKALVLLLVTGARLGVSSHKGTLNVEEKRLVKDVFGQAGDFDESIYNAIAANVEEEDYTVVEMLAELGNDVLVPFLFIILSFAYIDGKVDDLVLENIDELVGMNLLTLFMESGQEEVPSPIIKLAGLEEEILDWFKKDDQVRTIDDIVAHFPGKNSAEVKEAMDNLCNKGLMHDSDIIMGHIYWYN